MTKIQSPVGVGDFPLFNGIQTGNGAYLDSYTVGTRGSILGDKADHSPLSSAEVMNDGVISPLSHIPSWHRA
jgi:hypothetical protein